MSYFAENYPQLRFPIEAAGSPGLRRSQSGAIFAIGSHFTLRSEPAVIVMPTGSGKTAVLSVSPYLLRANRVLVVTPSRLVRGQVYAELTDLKTLKEVGVLPSNCPPPRTIEVQGRITDSNAWEELANYDVVIGTPFSVSPALADVPNPPPDLFDLVLIDEGHHSPARVWNELLAAFPNARRILFTATPFRRDAREIKGRFIWSYPIAEALKDGIFGEISYLPVNPPSDIAPDVAIAQEAERTLLEDRSAGMRHALMVRVDSRKRADELADVYATTTTLRLRTVHSSHTYSHIRNTINRLRRGELDGIICVDMMGEGFDFPELKIAAIHSPHKSLAVTLQFIGRFARTNAPNLGTAKFLAIPADIEIEAQRLYEEHAVWQRLVPNLLQSRIDEEIRTRNALASFEAPESEDEPTASENEDVSLYALSPFHHLKVFRVDGTIDVSKDLDWDAPEIVYREFSEELTTVVLVLRFTATPDWTHVSTFSTVEHELVVLHYSEASELLFICSSLREEWLYKALVGAFVEGDVRPLPPDRIYKALQGLEEFEFFNIGMRNRALAANSESYRIIAGSSAQKAISKGDGDLYHRGHTYGRARDGDEWVTIGLSSASKIWSNKHTRIPQLIDWCDELARRMSSAGTVRTGSELDFLQTGREVDSIPAIPVAATWDKSAYLRPLVVYYALEDAKHEIQLLDLEIRIDREHSTENQTRLVIEGDHLALDVDFSLNDARLFELAPSSQELDANVGGPMGSRPLIQYLNSEPPVLFLADGSSLTGRIWYPPPGEGFAPYDIDRITTIDWITANVDIEAEKQTEHQGMRTVHQYVEERLESGDAQIIFFDDGTGEAADFVTVTRREDTIDFELYHCKGSGGASPGRRIDDAYEVCGQAEKSVFLVRNPQKLFKHVERRLRRQNPSRFARGSSDELQEILAAGRSLRSRYVIYVVQPGISKAQMTPEIASVLAAADGSLRQGGCVFEVWGSQ